MVLGIITGVICGLFKYQLESAGKGLLLGSIIYIISLYIIIYIFRIKPDNVEIKLKNIFADGAGSFIALWLYLWILVLNLLYSL